MKKSINMSGREKVEVFTSSHLESIQIQIERFVGEEDIKNLMAQSWENIVAKLMGTNSPGIDQSFLKSEVLTMIQSALDYNATGGEFRQSKQTALEELQNIVKATRGEGVPMVNG